MINYRDYSKLRNIVTFVTYNLAKFLVLFFKKKDNVWVFGEKQGTLFSSNAKYLFLYVLRNHKSIKPIWFTNKPDIIKEVSDLGGKSYLINSLKAFYYGLVAKVYIFTVGLSDIGNFAVRNALIINLWHGMPIKNLNNTRNVRKIKYSCFVRNYEMLIAKITTKQLKKYHLLIATSEVTKSTIEASFPNNPVKITGEPKNDILYQNIERKIILEKYSLQQYESKKIVTYLPTFRLLHDYRFLFNENEDIDEIDNFIILEKSHANDLEMSKRGNNYRKNIINISNTNIDTQELLCITDILITDYSSCYVDFLLTGKPVIFYPYDLEDYQKTQGFFFEYKSIVSGPIVKNEKSLLKAIISNLNDDSLYQVERKKQMDFFHLYQDDNSSHRVYSEIMILLDSIE